jgi:hypothetical protein
MREFQHLMILEQRMIDCCEERSQISETSQNIAPESRSRHEQRLGELHAELMDLWREYRKLARPKSHDLKRISS